MSTLNEDLLEKKLLGLKDTHESISGLSAWCLEHAQHHKKIVTIWLQVLKKVKIEQRLTLFYLANDVIQYSKRKGLDFVESWVSALQKATTMVRDDKVKNKILRLFKIWDERSIYEEAFLVDLSGLLSSRKSAQSSTEAQDFQPMHLINKIKSCKTLEDDTDFKRKIVNDSHLSLNDADALHSALKDRRHGSNFEEELEEGVEKMVDFISALKTEIKERAALIEVLEQAETFYENQRGEAKVVCNAYRNFNKRMENLKKKLTELTKTLPSPLPSPDINAPSPSPESDIDLPDEAILGDYSAAKTFMGTLVVPEKLELSRSPPAQIYSLLESPVDSPKQKKFAYKPPTPPRSLKRKASPKPYQSPPPAAYISRSTPTLSSSSASNYSSNSPYQPIPKPVPSTAGYSIPSVTSVARENEYPPATSYSDTYDPDQYQSDERSQSYIEESMDDSYHMAGTNPPAPTLYNPPPPVDTYQGRNTSKGVYPSFDDRSLYQNPPPPPVAAPPDDFSVPPPAKKDYEPFYTPGNLASLPLLGEDCPPTNINGLDSFLQSNSTGVEDAGDVGSGFSSFMGNLSIPFDLQKSLFSDNYDTPESPPPENMEDSISQPINFFSDSNHSGEGKPIEVINRTKQPDIQDILKALTGHNIVSRKTPPLPPPLPPTPTEAPPPLLPPKFPTWGGGDPWADTPASPPLYDKAGFGAPQGFDEGDSLPPAEADTDLRTLGMKGDIDHRNLISLTSSPRNEAPWTPRKDTDYRKMVTTSKRGGQDDNVESVDMEMASSEEEGEEDATKSREVTKSAAAETKADTEALKPQISFSLTPHNKHLNKSPLVEKEEAKTRKSLLPLPKRLDISTPPPRLSEPPPPKHMDLFTPPPKLPEPPPLPNVDEIFPELNSSGEGEENENEGETNEDTVLSSPLLPPPMPPQMMDMGQSKPIPQLNPGFAPNRFPPNLPPNQFFPNHRSPRPFFNNRGGNNRPRFPPRPTTPGNNMRPPIPGMRTPGASPRFRPDNFRGRPPWFGRGGNQRPPHFAGGW